MAAVALPIVVALPTAGCGEEAGGESADRGSPDPLASHVARSPDGSLQKALARTLSTGSAAFTVAVDCPGDSSYTWEGRTDFKASRSNGFITYEDTGSEDLDGRPLRGFVDGSEIFLHIGGDWARHELEGGLGASIASGLALATLGLSAERRRGTMTIQGERMTRYTARQSLAAMVSQVPLEHRDAVADAFETERTFDSIGVTALVDTEGRLRWIEVPTFSADEPTDTSVVMLHRLGVETNLRPPTDVDRELKA